MSKINFLNNKARFSMSDPDMFRTLYFPIASEKGLKSVVTPNLNGDSKLDQNTFLLEPASIEDLSNKKNGRNFWCIINDEDYVSVVGNSAMAEAMKFNTKDTCELEAGFMWQKVSRSFEKFDISSEVTSFVPYDENVEIMSVKVTNNGSKEVELTPVAAIPLFGRSADNLRDHRHVTSLLHRIRTTESGVLVRPTLSFDERGHQKNKTTYFVCGSSSKGGKPVAFYPTNDLFCGDAGSFANPEAVALKKEGVKAGSSFEGTEAVGAFAFEKVTLAGGESRSYTIIIGATEDESSIEKVVKRFELEASVKEALEATENYWNDMVNISVKTGNEGFDNYMRWVCFQPFLRRIYGCSFLPHHDYGKGGRGWRDLWQDCLALLIMDPSNVRKMIIDNFSGVRIDGTNATIIGTKPGEFIADRNGISRVWMDHGMWPFLTTKLYLEQSGDLELLNIKVPYFKDAMVERGFGKDELFETSMGTCLLTEKGEVYKGTVLEHLLLQHVCAVLEVGEHGIIKLRGADWNDALDMAADKGESVAFSCAYAGNLIDMAKYITKLSENGAEAIELNAEFAELVEAVASGKNKDAAVECFLKSVAHKVSGQTRMVDSKKLAEAMEKLANDLMNHIRTQEWISDSKGNEWFNSYYDNNARRVEGEFDGNVRMMLTGQVFSIMSGTASEEQISKICKAADTYLYEKEVGGYKLNSNFHEEKYDMGRAFGFAYGEKENGAVFSHMTVMYAYALYKRGFIREGYKALQSLADTALDFETSQIYPGIPEYFNAKGRGLYHYLTGAASWYALTMVTEVYGVRGEFGKLCVEPKLVSNQFNNEGVSEIELNFDGKHFVITYENEAKLDFDGYEIKECTVDGVKLDEISKEKVLIDTKTISDNTEIHNIKIKLGKAGL